MDGAGLDSILGWPEDDPGASKYWALMSWLKFALDTAGDQVDLVSDHLSGTQAKLEEKITSIQASLQSAMERLRTVAASRDDQVELRLQRLEREVLELRNTNHLMLRTLSSARQRDGMRA